MAESTSVVLLSGGMDSLVTAAIAMRDSAKTYFLHVNYGQRTEVKELDCFHQICQHYGPEKTLVINLDWLGQLGGSALTDTNIPIGKHENMPGIPQTYVPFRNAVLLSAAVSWAEVLGADRIYVGAVEEDGSGYPDCTEAFFAHFQAAIDTGTRDTTSIKLITPVIHLSKAEIVKIGMDLQAPFQYSWSCYKDNITACGVCDSCHLRLRAFRQAGFVDPISYAEGTQL